MKTLLNLAAVLTLALTANMARADVDYDDLAEECHEAHQLALQFNQIAQNLPADFPNRDQFQQFGDDMVSTFGNTADDLEQIDNGHQPEPSDSDLNSFRQQVQYWRTAIRQQVVQTARQIERNSNGQTEDLAKDLRRLADDIVDHVEEMLDELD